MCMMCVAQGTPFIGTGLTVLRRRSIGPYIRSKLPPRWRVSRKERVALLAASAATPAAAARATGCKGHCKHGSHHHAHTSATTAAHSGHRHEPSPPKELVSS
jgi:hypothetical protein